MTILIFSQICRFLGTTICLGNGNEKMRLSPAESRFPIEKIWFQALKYEKYLNSKTELKSGLGTSF